VVGYRPEHVIELGSNDAVKRSVVEGRGISCLSARTIEAEQRASLIAHLPIPGWRCHRSCWLIHRPDQTLGLAARAFLAIVREEPRAS